MWYFSVIHSEITCEVEESTFCRREIRCHHQAWWHGYRIISVDKAVESPQLEPRPALSMWPWWKCSHDGYTSAWLIFSPLVSEVLLWLDMSVKCWVGEQELEGCLLPVLQFCVDMCPPTTAIGDFWLAELFPILFWVDEKKLAQGLKCLGLKLSFFTDSPAVLYSRGF